MSFNPDLIRASFEKAKPIASDVATKFYDFLWSDYPQSKALFASTDMAKQKSALVGALSFIVDNIENENKLRQYLLSMGARHNKYGTEPEHYEWVGGSLLKTFAYFFGSEWTPELSRNWAAAFEVIASIMIEGQRTGMPARTNSKPAKKAKKMAKRTKTSIDLTIELPKDFRNQLKQLVQDAFEQAVQDEVKRLVDQEVENLSKADPKRFFKKAS